MSTDAGVTAGEKVAAARATEVELFSLAGNDGHLREVNEAFARLLGLPLAEVHGRSVLELVHPDDIVDIVAGLAALEGGAAEVILETRFMQPTGTCVHLQWVARSIPGTDQWWASGRDTTEFHRVLDEQVDLQARLDLALGPSKAAMWELDVRSGSLTWESQAAEVLGVTSGVVPGSAAELVAVAQAADQARIERAVQQLTEQGAAEVDLRVGEGTEVRHLKLRGKVLDRDRRGRALRAVGIVLDVTTEKAMEEQMLLMAMSDALTGVPNRRAFDQALRSEWRRCTRSGEPLAIVMIDIDEFKGFNDRFGHLVGDDALCRVARALKATIQREGDVIARFGGEEFAVVLPNTDGQGALAVGNRLVDAVRSVVIRQAAGWSLTVSVGTASCTPDTAGFDSAGLVSRADQALYAAKSSGKNRATAHEDCDPERVELEEAMARGLAEGEFELYYQPIITLEAGEVVGFEALMRWNRPGHGVVAPDAFIPTAEASALICDLGQWALQEAACQLATWSIEGLDSGAALRMAVNVSGSHVASPAIVADVEAALAAAGIAPDRLELELTETMLADDGLVSTHLARIRELDITVAIDDFGTGHASFGQLSQLSVDTLKIDRSFVSSTDPRRRALVTLMIEAAHAFDLRVVAEGVEDEETLKVLRTLGCDAAQGYLMARPMQARSVPAWLAEWRGAMSVERPVVQASGALESAAS